jgi:hypothetical protein
MAIDGTYTCAHGVTRNEPRQSVVITALGITQIFAWGCSYYLLAVLATPRVLGRKQWKLSPPEKLRLDVSLEVLVVSL